MEFQSLAKQALPLHNPVLNTGVVAELARLIYCMEFQSFPSSMFPLPQGERMEVRGLIYVLSSFYKLL